MFSRSTFSLIRTATKSTTTVAAMRNATRGFATVATNTVRSQQQNLIGVGTGCFLGVGLIQFVDQKVGISPNSPAINPQTEARTLSAAAAAEKEPPSLMKKCIAEAIGTGIIVAGGCGAVAASKYAGGGMGLLGVAISFGASVTLAVYSTANISGAHLNPAVTLNAVVNGGFDAAEGAAFSVAQMVGATLASGLTYLSNAGGIKAFEKAGGIVRGSAASVESFAGAFGMVHNAAVVKTPAAFAVEIGFTAALVFMISALTDPSNAAIPDGAAPALIGATVTTLIVGGGPITGCGMNPARDLGPRVVTMLTGWGKASFNPGFWIYTAGPLVGAVAGGALYNVLLK